MCGTPFHTAAKAFLPFVAPLITWVFLSSVTSSYVAANTQTSRVIFAGARGGLWSRSLAGISPRTLSLRLRALEEAGIVERQTYPEVPPRVEYALTTKGQALVPLIEDMRTYGREWLGADCEESVAEVLAPVGAAA